MLVMGTVTKEGDISLENKVIISTTDCQLTNAYQDNLRGFPQFPSNLITIISNIIHKKMKQLHKKLYKTHELPSPSSHFPLPILPTPTTCQRRRPTDQ